MGARQLHFMVNDADPYALVARLARTLAPGSYLAATHATTDFMPKVTDDMRAAVRRESARSRDPGQFRDLASFGRFFAGLELVPPGIVSVADWHNDVPVGERPSPADTMCYAAVARIP